MDAVRGHLLEMTGDRDGAAACFLRAANGTANLPERRHLMFERPTARDRHSRRCRTGSKRTSIGTLSNTEGGAMNFNSILIGSDNALALADYYTKLFGTPGSRAVATRLAFGAGFLTVGPHSEIHGQNKEPARLDLEYGISSECTRTSTASGPPVRS